MDGVGYFGVAGGKWGDKREHLYSTASHQQIHLLQTAPTQRSQQFSTWNSPHGDQVLWGHYTAGPAERHTGTAQRPLLRPSGASVITLHTILLGVGCTIYNNYTLEPFKELGLDSQRGKKLASKLHVHSVYYAAKLVHTRHALSSTVINSHQKTASGEACNPPDPQFLFLLVEEFHGTQYQSGSFPLINVGSGFSLHTLVLFLLHKCPLPSGLLITIPIWLEPSFLHENEWNLASCTLTLRCCLSRNGKPQEEAQMPLHVSASIGCYRKQNNIFSYSMPVVFIPSAFFPSLVPLFPGTPVHTCRSVAGSCNLKLQALLNALEE